MRLHFIKRVLSMWGIQWSEGPALLSSLYPHPKSHINYIHYYPAVLRDSHRDGINIIKPNTCSFYTVSVPTNILTGTSSIWLYERINNISRKLLQQPFKFQSFEQNSFCSYRFLSDASSGSGKIQKPLKSKVKEFNFKGKTSDHDLSVKINKIKALLEKGKVVQVFLRASRSNAKGLKSDSIPVTNFQQTLADGVGTMGKLHKDFSNEAVTRFTLTPAAKKESESLELKNNNNIDNYNGNKDTSSE